MTIIDSFSGALCDLKTTQRTTSNAIRVLAKSPRISTWDMEMQWVRVLLDRCEREGLITRDDSEPYPWLKFTLTDKARAAISRATGASNV